MQARESSLFSILPQYPTHRRCDAILTPCLRFLAMGPSKAGEALPLSKRSIELLDATAELAALTPLLALTPLAERCDLRQRSRLFLPHD